MTVPRAFSMTDAEHRRIDRIDRLVLQGAAGVGELIGGLADASWTVRRAVVAGLAALGDDAVSALCAWLRDERSTERAIAAVVDALSASVGAATTSTVVALLGDPDPAVVADAAQILGRRAAGGAAPALAGLLGHPNDNVAVAAIEALGAIGGSHAIDALIDVVGQRSFFRTFPALLVLARADDARVVAPLASLLDDDTYRIEAARALGRTGYAQAIGPLLSLLPHPGEAIVRLVALGLADLVARAEWRGAGDHVGRVMRGDGARFAARFVAALRTADATERNAIAVVLGRIGDRGVVPDLARLLDDPDARAAATDAVQRIVRQHEDELIEAVASGDPAIRAAVLPAVHTMRAATAVRALVGDDDPELRATACEALARIGDTAALPLLFTALGDPNPRVGHAAATAIQTLGASTTAPLAIAALGADQPVVRRHALRIISCLGLAEAFAPVIAVIDDPDPRTAELAVGALRLMDEPGVDRMLERLVLDPREPVRAAAMRVAGDRGGAIARRVLEAGVADDAAWVRYYACQGLGRIGDDAATALVVARLADAMPHVRIAAIEALAHMAAPAAWQALCSAIRSSDLDEQRAALASMGRRPGDDALGFLLEAARSPDVPTRLIALSGLARRAEPAALAAITEGAGEQDPVVRDAALSLLADRQDAPGTTALVELALAVDLDHPAHRALSLPGGVRVEAIVRRLATADDRGAAALVAALARMGDELATTALVAALASPNPAVRRASAGALIAVGAAGARAAAAELARTDPDLEVRRACAAMSAGSP